MQVPLSLNKQKCYNIFLNFDLDIKFIILNLKTKESVLTLFCWVSKGLMVPHLLIIVPIHTYSCLSVT